MSASGTGSPQRFLLHLQQSPTSFAAESWGKRSNPFPSDISGPVGPIFSCLDLFCSWWQALATWSLRSRPPKWRSLPGADPYRLWAHLLLLVQRSPVFPQPVLGERGPAPLALERPTGPGISCSKVLSPLGHQGACSSSCPWCHHPVQGSTFFFSLVQGFIRGGV